MLTFVFASSLALADIPPPQGTRNISFGLTVDNAEAFPDFVLVVYPWSLSNGAPMAEIGQVPGDGVLQFGRRIAGSPEFWAIPKGSLPSAKGAELKAFFDGGGAVHCGGSIQRVSTGPSEGPAQVVQAWHIDSMNAGSCALSLAAPEQEGLVVTPPNPTSSALGCATVPGVAGLAALFGGGLLLLMKRPR